MSNVPEVPSEQGADEEKALTQSPRIWQDNGWIAHVIKNEDDEGWAVAMTKDGEREPALIGPWTMGRDEKNPKPLDSSAFSTLVKTASEVIRRHEQQLHASLHKKIDVTVDAQRYSVTLDIVPDEDEPYAVLKAHDRFGAELATVQVPPTFKLTQSSALEWVKSDFPKMG